MKTHHNINCTTRRQTIKQIKLFWLTCLLVPPLRKMQACLTLMMEAYVENQRLLKSWVSTLRLKRKKLNSLLHILVYHLFSFSSATMCVWIVISGDLRMPQRRDEVPYGLSLWLWTGKERLNATHIHNFIWIGTAHG